MTSLIHNKITKKNVKHIWVSLTAGLALLLVSGKRRVPAPPPNIIEATVVGSTFGYSNNGASNV